MSFRVRTAPSPSAMRVPILRFFSAMRVPMVMCLPSMSSFAGVADVSKVLEALDQDRGIEDGDHLAAGLAVIEEAEDRRVLAGRIPGREDAAASRDHRLHAV